MIIGFLVRLLDGKGGLLVWKMDWAISHVLCQSDGLGMWE